MSVDSYVYQIDQIDKELKRLGDQSKALRLQKKQQTKALYGLMKSQGLEKVGTGKKTITLEKCEKMSQTGGQRAKAKPKGQKKREEIGLLREQGVPNPEALYAQLESVRKPIQNDSIVSPKNTSSSSGKKQKSSLDEMLGF